MRQHRDLQNISMYDKLPFMMSYSQKYSKGHQIPLTLSSITLLYNNVNIFRFQFQSITWLCIDMQHNEKTSHRNGKKKGKRSLRCAFSPYFPVHYSPGCTVS